MIAHETNRINPIDVMRGYTGMGLAEARLMVEGFPTVRLTHIILRSRAQAFAQDLKPQGAVMLDLPPSR